MAKTRRELIASQRKREPGAIKHKEPGMVCRQCGARLPNTEAMETHKHRTGHQFYRGV